MKQVRKVKNDLYNNWKVVTDTEEGRRTFLDMNDNDADGAVTLEPQFD